MNKEQTLYVSFSGGRTSAYMTYLIKRDNPDAIVIFCNTGQEHEDTLRFVDACDYLFGWGVVWLESVFHAPKNVGTTHRIVDYTNATRDGSLFDAMCSKYGLPNHSYPHCTRELKLRPFYSYVRSLGNDDYKVAVGIRADEIDRMTRDKRIVYPLVKAGIRKSDVMAFWGKQIFDLQIPEHLGNCVWCWKKSDRKLRKVLDEMPDAFKVPDELENKYSGIGVKPRVLFMKNRSTRILIENITDDDAYSGCSESCELFTEENMRACE